MLQLRHSRLQRLEEKPGIAQLVFVGRMGKQVERPLVSGFFIINVAGEVQAFERVLIGEEHVIVESQLRIRTVSKRNVTQFVGQYHGQRSLIGKNIEQAAA